MSINNKNTKRRIAVIDESMLCQEAIKNTLRKNFNSSDYSLRFFKTIEEFIDKKKHNPALVILDVSLPRNREYRGNWQKEINNRIEKVLSQTKKSSIILMKDHKISLPPFLAMEERVFDCIDKINSPSFQLVESIREFFAIKDPDQIEEISLNSALQLAVIDDDVIYREGIKNFIKHNFPFEVSVNKNKENLLSNKNTYPAIILLDYFLKESDSEEQGVKNLKEIKRMYPYAYIIVLTGDHTPRIKNRSLANGAFSFIQKGKNALPTIKKTIKHILETNKLNYQHQTMSLDYIGSN